jgi:hypothetical protein
MRFYEVVMAHFESSLPKPPRQQRFPSISAGFVALALLLAATNAGARPEFPEAVQNAFEPALACAPPCTLCHTSPSGGAENATQPFAVNLSAILGRLSVAEMKQSIEGLRTLPCRRMTDPACAPDPMMCMPCDADGDDTIDVEELENDTNPNGGADLKCPHYGCGASRIAPPHPGRPIDGTAALAALGTLVLLASRWRRR